MTTMLIVKSTKKKLETTWKSHKTQEHEADTEQYFAVAACTTRLAEVRFNVFPWRRAW